MTDTQDTKPQVEVGLDRVGITNLKTLIETQWRGQKFRFSPKIEIAIDLEGSKKGIHMSRLVESITEAVEEEARKPAGSIEEIEKNVLEHLGKKHSYKRGEIKMEMDFFMEKKTPATNKKTTEAHQVSVCVLREDKKYYKTISVTVYGNTVCPHAYETAGVPHIQRAIAILGIKTLFENRVDIEDMIDCVEKSFSSPVYTLLKTVDEVEVVRKMHSNPKFVEDVVRGILDNAKNRFSDCEIFSRAVSEESIHRHDVIAEGSAKT